MKTPWKPYTIEEADLVAVWVPGELAGEFARYMVQLGRSYDYDPVAFGQSAKAPAHLFAFTRTSEDELRRIVADFQASMVAAPLPAPRRLAQDPEALRDP